MTENKVILDPSATEGRRFPLESAAESRRRQLLAVAAHIVETEGYEALRMPRVAELAGCARALVYRYFPRRQDFLIALLSNCLLYTSPSPRDS